MTSHEVDMQNLSEQRRHNQEQEGIGKEANRVREEGNILQATTNTIGKLLNHPSWYTNDQDLAKNAGELSFNFPAGLVAQPKTRFSTNTNPVSNYAIAVHYYAPTIGRTLDVEVDSTTLEVTTSRTFNSSINVAARQLYAYIRHANAGNKNYEAVDLMMYILSIVEVYEFVAMGMRLYGAINTYKSRNRLFGDQLIRSLGFIPDNVRSNMPQLLFNINQAVKKLASFCLPGNLTIINRRL